MKVNLKCTLKGKKRGIQEMDDKLAKDLIAKGFAEPAEENAPQTDNAERGSGASVEKASKEQAKRITELEMENAALKDEAEENVLRIKELEKEIKEKNLRIEELDKLLTPAVSASQDAEGKKKTGQGN